MKCPYCSHEGPPTEKEQLSIGGWILFGVLIIACLPLCWIPWVLDATKDTVRKCAQCGARFP